MPKFKQLGAGVARGNPGPFLRCHLVVNDELYKLDLWVLFLIIVRMSSNTHTQYAPAERATWEELYEQMEAVNGNACLQGALRSAPERVLLVNAQRQIVYVNEATMQAFGVKDPAEVYACRPGEVLGCVHANKGEGGCGTHEDCRFCGGLNAVMRGLRELADVQKFQITIQDYDIPLDLVVHTIPVRVGDFFMCLVTFLDTDNESAMKIAENTFKIQHFAAEIEEASRVQA